jgi:hypothetical protein
MWTDIYPVQWKYPDVTQLVGQGASLTWIENSVPLELILSSERSAFSARGAWFESTNRFEQTEYIWYLCISE